MLAPSCCHAFIFEGQALPGIQGKQHPYVIEPGDDPRREYLAGNTLTFNLLLFGRANDYLPHVVYAVQEMGKDGLGKNTSSQGRFTLETVSTEDDAIFTAGVLNKTGSPPELEVKPATGPPIREPPPMLTVDLGAGKLIHGRLELDMHPAGLALYAFFAERKISCRLHATCRGCGDCPLIRENSRRQTSRRNE